MQKNSRAVFLFDGQGCQYYGMGKDLYDTHPSFRNSLLELDAEAIRITGSSIIEHMYQPVHGPFNQLRFAHPAIYMVQYAMAMTLRMDFDLHPADVLGNDLGEAVAAAVSGAVDPLDMLGTVIAQADVLDHYRETGGMITILQHPLTLDTVPPFHQLYEAATLVTINHCGHFTIAAGTEVLNELKSHLDYANIPYRQLPVPVALHSALIDEAKNAFVNSSQASFSKPVIPFVSGIHARHIQHITPHYLWQTMREQLRFSDSIRYLESTGDYFYVDCSPAGTLQSICRHIIPRSAKSSIFGIMNTTHEGMRNLELLKRRPDLSMPLIYRSSL